MNKEELLHKIFDGVTRLSRVGSILENECIKYRDTLEILERHNLQDLELYKQIILDHQFLVAVKIELNHGIESVYTTMIIDIIRLNALGRLL